MSGNVGGQIRGLPFTGVTALPFLVIGLVLSTCGALIRKFSRAESKH